ncbi:MFS transporter [Vannielia litorea]|uniref:MFS transporter, DHA1 family, tetracycline resistance protein n=1 Tax=Vannielia litorea TaxID=1217970 RepID=A0A1N6GQP9_9RHOB|nr:MFS transporter, DHA1 family, tetracycline resistance protein [Vannielia litorea]
MFRNNGPLFFILATLMLDAIGIGIVFPIMPDLMARVGAGNVGEGSLWAGVLMAAYAGAQFVCGPVVGSVSDAWGRRPVLLVALACLVLDYVLMALADTFWLLLIGRTLAGVAGATYITATAYISDITPREQRAARFGLIGAAFGVGFVLGPALGGVVAGWHVTAPFWVAAALAAANLALGLFVLPESLAPENRRPFGARDINPFASFRRAFALPGLALPLICLALFEFANMVYPVLWAFWGKAALGWSTLAIGLSLSAYGVMMALAQAVVMPQLVARLGERRVVIMGLAVSAFSMVVFGFATTTWVVMLVMPFSALSDIVPPTLTALVANSAGEDEQGMVQGVIAALASLAAVLAPLMFTPLFRAFAAQGAPVYWPGAPFVLGALLVAAILPMVVRRA